MAQVDTSHWEKDDDVTKCHYCSVDFSFSERKHHCRVCGKVLCDDCSFLRGPSEKNPDIPIRQCSKCFIDYAFAKTGVAKEPPTERLPPPKGDYSTPGTFTKQFIGNSYVDDDGHTHRSKGAIDFDPSGVLDLSFCHLEGIQKGGNGKAVIKYCYITDEDALIIGGNAEVEIYNCVVVGVDSAATLGANATLNATDCFFIATGVPRKKRGTGILVNNGTKVTLNNCIVAGSNGVLLNHGSKLKAKKGMISCQKSKILSAFLSEHYAVAGEYDLDDVKVKGPLTKNANDKPPLSKLTGKVTKAV